MATIGSLVVSLEANIARFTSDMDKAAKISERTAKQIEKAIGFAKVAVGGLGAAMTLDGAADFVQRSIESAAALERLHKQTGLSVTALGALSDIAQLSGVDIGDLTKSFNVLQKSAFAAAGGAGAQAKAFAAIGISASQLGELLKKPDELLMTVAKRLAQYADDGNKAALMQLLFGRGGAEMAMALSRLAEQGRYNSLITEEQAKQAEELHIKLTQWRMSLEGVARSYALKLLPLLQQALPTLKLIGQLAAIAWLRFTVWPAAITGILTVGIPFLNWLRAVYVAFIELMPLIAAGEWGALNIALTGTAMTMKSIATFAGFAAVATNALFAALAGFAIGKWLYDQFPQVRQWSIAIVSVFSDAWLQIEYGFKIAFANMGEGFRNWVKDIAQVLKTIPPVGPFGMAARAGSAMLGSLTTGNFQTPEKLKAELAMEMAARRMALQDLINENGPGGYNPVEIPQVKLPPIPTFNAGEGSVKVLREQLSALEDALKLQDELLKASNKQLDADYQQGLISLADYGEQKLRLLDDNLAAANDLYAQQAAAIARAMAVEQDVQKRQQMAAMLEDVRAKAAQNALQYVQDQSAATEDLRKASADYARQLIDLDIQYRTLMGDTQGATIEQLAQADALLRARLMAEGATDALAKLDAIERDRILRATNTWRAGVERAASDYARNIADVGKAMEEFTTRSLQGMEDALVEFCKTGKLNWREMINSMIVDLMRLVVRMSVIQPLANMISGGVGSLFGGGFAVSAGVANAMNNFSLPVNLDIGGARASGGPVTAGTTYLVGEKGPELFAPKASGTIVPSFALAGAGGGINLNYSIDARGADAERIMAVMPSLLKRTKDETVAEVRALINRGRM